MISSSPTEIRCCPKCAKDAHPFTTTTGIWMCGFNSCECHSTTQKKETCPKCQFEQPRYPHEKSAHQKDCSRAQKKECCENKECDINHKQIAKELAEEETIKNPPSLTGSDPNLLKNTPTTLSRIDEIVAELKREFDTLYVFRTQTNIGGPYTDEIMRGPNHETCSWIKKEDVAILMTKIQPLITSLLSEIEERIEAGKFPTLIGVVEVHKKVHNAALTSASEVVRSFKV